MEGGVNIIKVGEMNKLKISNVTSFGVFLDAETDKRNDNVLLPRKEMPGEIIIGEYLEVFVYRDSEERVIATLRKPLAMVGELAYLKVTAKTSIGVFLDIGLERGLFLPFSEQKYSLIEGKNYLVYVYLDKSSRLCCTTDIMKYLTADAPYKQYDKISGTVYQVRSDIGVFVAVDNKYMGLIPKSECYTNFYNGDRVEARVIRVREDGKLDLSPREMAYKQMDEDEEIILKSMKENGGILQFGEKASPQQIQKKYKISKSAYKRAIGGLLKSGKIIKTDDEIKLITE